MYVILCLTPSLENCTWLQHIYSGESLVLCSRSVHICLLCTMASQHLGHFPPSPTKKSKTKRFKCRPGDDVDSSLQPSQPKKNKLTRDFQATGGTEGNTSYQEPCCSRRPGAGTGGQVAQLEKVRNTLEEGSTWLQSVMAIPESLPDNPLALPKRQRRKKVKVSHQYL